MIMDFWKFHLVICLSQTSKATQWRMAENRHNSSRRSFCAIASGAAVSLAMSTGCSRRDGANASSAGTLTARPHESRKSNVSGRTTLGLDSTRDAILLTPKAEPNGNFPLLVFLHGAGQSAEEMFEYLGTAPEEAGVAVLAPNSRDSTWDAIGGSFGTDVKFVNRALERVFEMLPIDVTRVIIGGFSDGASYAISLGLLNGDLFKGVMAFSPGFVIEGTSVGKPRFYISHGKHDRILPIEKCGRRITAYLTAHGYGVTFREFDGGHEIPADVLREGFRWLGSL
jgi:phospholipase/carboxylesterase